MDINVIIIRVCQKSINIKTYFLCLTHALHGHCTHPIWKKTPLTKGNKKNILKTKIYRKPERAKGEAFSARTWSRFEKVLAPKSWAGTQTYGT
jgi:hypothetical protein